MSDTDSDSNKVNGEGEVRTKGLSKFYEVATPNDHDVHGDKDASPNLQLRTTPKGSGWN